MKKLIDEKVDWWEIWFMRKLIDEKVDNNIANEKLIWLGIMNWQMDEQMDWQSWLYSCFATEKLWFKMLIILVHNNEETKD